MQVKTKKYVPFLLLFLIPLITYLLAFNVFKNDVHWWSSPDPTYAYYLSSVLLVKNLEIEIYQHPGTPVILLGGMVITTAGLLKGLSGEELVNDLMVNAEYYIFIFKSFFTFLYCLILYIFGVYLFKFTKSTLLALLAQSTPLVLERIPIMTAWLKPEPLQLISALLLSMVLISLYKNDFEPNKVKYLFYFSVILGFAIAAKINSIPLLLVPLIMIPRFRNKLFFAVLTALFFVIFTSPILPKYGNVLDYYLNRSQLSASRPGVISLLGQDLLPVLMPFYICLTLIAVYFFVLLRLPEKYKTPVQNTTKKILGAIITASAATILMVIKHPHGYHGINGRYLIFILGLTGTMLFIFFYSLKEINFLSRFKQKIIASIIIIGVVWLAAATITRLTGEAQRTAVLGSEVNTFRKEIKKKFDKYGVIVSCPSKHPAYAYLFGNKYVKFKLILESKALFPNVYFFDPQKNNFYQWNLKKIELKKIKKKYSQVIFFDVCRFQYPPGILENWEPFKEMELRNLCIYSLRPKK